MVQSSIGISGAAPLIIGEESILDPLVGITAGLTYAGMKIFDKIRHKNNDDYSLDAPTNDIEERKEPTPEDMM
jgi:hypothetical protein